MEKLNEPIQVLARFRDGKFMPTRFLWSGRTHKVQEVTGRWATTEGGYKIYRFAVINENNTYFELSLNTRNMDWRLDLTQPGD